MEPTFPIMQHKNIFHIFQTFFLLNAYFSKPPHAEFAMQAALREPKTTLTGS